MFTLIFVLVFVASEATGARHTVFNTCPYKVLRKVDLYYLQVHDGFCFHFVVNERRDYDRASEDCVHNGGTLAMPKTRALNTYLADQLYNYYWETEKAWIGLHDKNQEGLFEWEDRTLVKWSNFALGNGPYSNWFTSRFEDCVAMDPADKGSWHDYQCYESLMTSFTRSQPKKMYICQYPPRYVAPAQSVAEFTTIPAPVYTTSIPVNPTIIPVGTTPAPVDTTPIPVDTTPVSVDTTPVPVDTTPASVDTTPVPVDTTPVPVDTTPVPVDTTPVSVDTTHVSVDTTPVSVDTTPVSVDTTPVSVDTTPVPVDTTPIPEDTTTLTVDTTTIPVDTTIFSPLVDTTTIPVDTTTVPVDATTAPVDTTTVPVDTTTAPVDTTTISIPVDITTIPVDTTTAPPL